MSTVVSFPSTCKHGEISFIRIKIHPNTHPPPSSLQHLPTLQKAEVLRKLFWLVLLSFYTNSSIQLCSVAQSYPTLCYPMDCSTPGLPVHHQLPEPTQTHVHWVGDVIQPCHPLSSPSPPILPLRHFIWVSISMTTLKAEFCHSAGNDFHLA